VLSPGAPSRFRIFRINMWALAISHTLPGGTVPGTAASYKLLTDADVPGSTAGFGLATQGIGSAVVLNIIFWLALLISIPLNGYNPLYGFAAILGVVLLSVFGGLVFLLTRGEQQAGAGMARVPDRLHVAGGQGGVLDLAQGVHGLHQRHPPALLGHRAHLARQPVVGVHEVVPAGGVGRLDAQRLEREVADLSRDVGLVELLERARRHVPDQYARGQLGDRRGVTGDGTGEDLDLGAAGGQPLRHLDHVDVQASGVAGSWLVER